MGGTIQSRQDALDYLTWTYFFRRLLQNPSYYDLDGTEAEDLNAFLSGMIEGVLGDLEEAGCLRLEDGEDEGSVVPTTLGRIASFYYLHHRSMLVFARDLRPGLGFPDLLRVRVTRRRFSASF